jgi:DNA-binding SARP family transcriptional activator
MPRLVALGRLTLAGDGDPLAARATRSRNLALLVLLARSGETGASREKLAALLWPESDSERARHSLDQAIYELRRAFGADVLVSGASTLALNHDLVPSDVVDFTRAIESGRLESAADLYTGPFLDGFHLSRSAEFEQWVERERAELHARYAAILESLGRTASSAGQHDRAIRYWRRLCLDDPFNSRATLGLMKALEAAGDRTGALQTAVEHEDHVRRELGTLPDPSILQLAEQLRRESDRSAHLAPGSPQAEPMAVQPATGSSRMRSGDANSISVDSASRSWDPAASEPPEDSAVGSFRAARNSHLSERSATMGRRFGGFRLLLLAGLAGVVVAGVAIRSRDVAPVSADRPTVLVEPFVNETGDATLEPFGRLAADWIAGGLVRTGLVQVVEPGMGAGSAETRVAGRVYGAGDSVRIQARIVRAATGAVLRALDAVSTPADNPSGALDPLRQKVLGALGTLYDPRLSAWSETSLRPPSYSAYREFAAGLEYHAVPRDLPAAEARFRAAIEIDPDYVLPRLWLAWSSIMVGDWARADSESVALRAYREGMSPLERAWHDRIAALIAGDNEAAYRAAQRMVAIAPRSGWVIALANAALDTHRPAAAIDALLGAGMENLGLEREHGWFLLTAAYHQLGEYSRELEAANAGIAAVGLDWGFGGPGVSALAALGQVAAIERRIDELRDLPVGEDGMPRATGALLNAARELRAHGFADAAAHVVDRELEREPIDSSGGSSAAMAQWARLQITYELGRWREAGLILRQAAQPTDFRGQAMTGLLAAREGDETAARRIADDLDTISEPFRFGEPMFWRARILAVLGDEEGTIASLRTAFARGQGAEAWYLVHVLRDFDPLRTSDAFRELVRPTGPTRAGSSPGS